MVDSNLASKVDGGQVDQRMFNRHKSECLVCNSRVKQTDSGTMRSGEAYGCTKCGLVLGDSPHSKPLVVRWSRPETADKSQAEEFAQKVEPIF